MKPNNWVSSSQAAELLTKQRVTWPLAAQNYQALADVRTKSFDLEGVAIRVQYNPARAISSGAKVDARSLSERKCFLCPANLPMEQERLPFGLHYLVLCNPYPIFPEHLTIPAREHTPQLILPRFDDFLELTRRLDQFTVFYNGPRCGASAPDHAHFQAATRGLMPLDNEVVASISTNAGMYSPLTQIRTHPLRGGVPSTNAGGAYGQVSLLTGNLRPGLVIQANTAEAASTLFRRVYHALPMVEGESEPMMNLFGMYHDNQWIITLIPRRRHRPWQYEAEGDDHLLSSPGAADIGGLFITPRETDFERITPALLRDVYQQVCLPDREVEDIFVHLPSN